MRPILVLATSLLFSACAASPERQALINEYNRTIPTCQTDAECKAKWDAAQVWVVRNSGYRIQTATDVLIQTFGPLGESMALAMVVLKEPTGDGYRITISTNCANIFGCRPDAWGAAVQFNRDIGAITATP